MNFNSADLTVIVWHFGTIQPPEKDTAGIFFKLKQQLNENTRVKMHQWKQFHLQRRYGERIHKDLSGERYTHKYHIDPKIMPPVSFQLAFQAPLLERKLIEPNTKCCLHISEYDTDEKIIPFTETSLKTCRNKKAIRDQHIRNSKFNVIVLPTEIDGVIGYHPSCYRIYRAVSSSLSMNKSRSKKNWTNGGKGKKEGNLYQLYWI